MVRFFRFFLIISLFCVALLLILRGNLYEVLPCVMSYFFFFFNPFSIAITSLGEERASLCAFRAFVGFVRVGLCLLPLPLGVRDWKRLLIVALPEPFYLLVQKLYQQIVGVFMVTNCANLQPLLETLCYLFLTKIQSLSLKQSVLSPDILMFTKY